VRARDYDLAGADQIERYARKHLRDRISNGCLSFYLNGMKALEQANHGLCKPVVANYADIAAAGICDKTSVKKHLVALKGLLCEVEIGEPVKGGKATMVRRYALEEIEAREAREAGQAGPPSVAQRLADALNSRQFAYGPETIQPKWSVTKTGRVQSARPCVQQHAAEVRLAKIARGCGPGEVVHSLDYRRAEPTVLCHLMEWPGWDGKDVYDIVAAAWGCERAAAKVEVNKLATCSSACSVLAHWPVKARDALLPYAQAVDVYKAKIWSEGAPVVGKSRRHVVTVGGNRLETKRGEDVHKGQMLAWKLQGSVADMLNAAALRIIEGEPAEGGRFVFPCHDAVYVIGGASHRDRLESWILEEAKRCGVQMQVSYKAVSVP
jgi:hypothetical protein